MYIPPAFRVDDPSTLASFIREHSFATVVSWGEGVLFASHLPVLYRPEDGSSGTLVSHMARANPQWRHFESGGEVLVMFHGPHAYISPTWYQTQLAVPTWNYAAVHVYGVPSLLSDHDAVVRLLSETIAAYEGTRERPWTGELPDDFRDKLVQGIVAFEIPISRLEGKFKLGQNRSPEDQQGVFDALSRSGNADSLAVVKMMTGVCDVCHKTESA